MPSELDKIARAICDSEAFMWLMVGSNHPEAQLSVLRQIWREHYIVNGGGYGAKIRTQPKMLKENKDA